MSIQQRGTSKPAAWKPCANYQDYIGPRLIRRFTDNAKDFEKWLNTRFHYERWREYQD